MTYAQAREHILQYLRSLGWEVKPHLKVPQAITPSGSVVRFKAQAVYVGPHSLWTDIRQLTPSQFVEEVMARERSQGRDPIGHRYSRHRTRKQKAHRAVDDLSFYDRGVKKRPILRKKDHLRVDRYEVVDRETDLVVGHVRAKWIQEAQRRAELKFGKGVQVWAEGRKPTPVGAERWSGGGKRPSVTGRDPGRWEYTVFDGHVSIRSFEDKAAALRFAAHRRVKHKSRGDQGRRIHVKRQKVSGTLRRLLRHTGGESIEKRKGHGLYASSRRAAVFATEMRDPGKRRIVHGRAHHGERTEHHTPAIRQEPGPVRYELHWYSPEDRREHVTDWSGPEAYGQAKREAEAYCDRSEAKRFIRLVRLRGTGRDPARYGKRYRGRHARARVQKNLRKHREKTVARWGRKNLDSRYHYRPRAVEHYRAGYVHGTSARKRMLGRDPKKTRDYEYVVYPSTRVEHLTGIEISGTGFKDKHLAEAKRVAKTRYGRGAGIYSVTKGRFVGWIAHDGRYRPFR